MTHEPFSQPPAGQSGAMDFSTLQHGEDGAGMSAAYTVQVTEQNFQSLLESSMSAPVILVLYAVTALLAATTIALYRTGHNWARHTLASIVLGVFVVAVATVRTAPPMLVEWSAIAGAVVSAVTLVFLWHPQSRAFMRPTLVDHEDASG